MQHLSLKKVIIKACSFALLSLFTFNAKAGGDSYEIYLNNKLLLRQYVTQPLNIKSLEFDKANASDRLVIFYKHCGLTGTGRSIAIKDENGKVLREWKFANATGSNESMVIPVKELMVIATNNNEIHLALYYAAQQLPKGRILTSVDVKSHNVTLRHAVSTGSLWGIIFPGLFGYGRFLG